jgi:hypothetical protein
MWQCGVAAAELAVGAGAVAVLDFPSREPATDQAFAEGLEIWRV